MRFKEYLKEDEKLNGIIYLDMDGVVANMLGYFKEKTGKNFEDLPSKERWDLAAEYQDMYAELDMLDGAKEMFNTIQTLAKQYHFDFQILTAIPLLKSFPNAEKQKEEWVRKHLSKTIKFNIGPHAVNKQEWCKPGDILIDDSVRNIEQWNEKGGIGITHRSPYRTITVLRRVLGDKVT